MILDSNIIIYSIQQRYRVLKLYLDQHRDKLKVSTLSKVEVMGYHRITPEDKQDFEEFFEITPSLGVTQVVIDQATTLRQQRKMSLGDAIIAATCQIHNEPLLTNNEADFDAIPGLTVIPMRTVL